MMQQDSFHLTVVLGSVLYILSGSLLQSLNLVKQAVLRKDRLLFGFRREGLRDMLKRQLSYFLLEECMREKDKRSREHSGGSVRSGCRGWFCTASSRFPEAGTANNDAS